MRARVPDGVDYRRAFLETDRKILELRLRRITDPHFSRQRANMQKLTGTVGENSLNAVHDVTLVQAILVLTQRPASLDPQRGKYLTTLDGDCGNKTKAAIRQFQYDQVFVNAAGNRSEIVAGATAGLVSPGDLTWRKILDAIPKKFGDLRILNGSKTVYIAASQAQLNDRVAAVARLTFQPIFRANVIMLINRIFDRHGIAIGICRSGDRRTFQIQYELLTSGRNVTSAGPGESNHNFGQAVDLGFEGLRWLQRNGTVVENETSWLHRLDPTQHVTQEALIFWNMLRNEGGQIGLHRGPVSDRPHLQGWSDTGIDMANRLADLLTRFGQMRWTGSRQRYQCDLGFGGDYFDVGTAAQIWNRQATVTAAMLTRARPQAGAPAITEQDLATMRASLRADFDTADANWQLWRER